jgi:hypothetical protein
MTKHWTAYLPEVGNNILGLGEFIEAERETIRAMQKRVEEAETKLRADVAKLGAWSSDEIKAAQLAAWEQSVKDNPPKRVA